MTLGAAAIYLAENGPDGKRYSLLTISDRMLTIGDLEYERPWRSKVIGLAPANAVCLGSGDTQTLRTLADMTHRQVHQDNPGEVPPSSIRVSEVARTYAQQFTTLRRHRADQLHLAPRGLTIGSFINEAPNLAEGLGDKMASERLGVTAIIAGMDSEGPHIYTVGGGDAQWREMAYETYCNSPGFTAIGTGASPLMSHFMSHNFDVEWGFWETLLLLYSGKKKAEAAAGVGPATDITTFSERGSGLLSVAFIERLDRYYREIEDAAHRKRTETLARMGADEHFHGLLAPPSMTPPATLPPPPVT
jgi:hypothetical protein